jgi:hypothetical protein
MIKTVKQACVFNPIIRDYRMSQAIENLAWFKKSSFWVTKTIEDLPSFL